MDGGRTELDFDIEKIIGEANSHSEDSGSRRMSLASMCMNSRKTEKLQTSVSLGEREMLAKKPQQSSIKRIQPGEASLRGDQSLTAAFAELNFGDRGGPVNPPVAKCKSSPNHTFSQYPNGLKNSVSSVCSQVMVIPCFHQSPNNGFDKFAGHESSNFLKVDTQELRKMQAGYCQPVDNFSTAQNYQFLSNVPVHGVEFPVISDQQQYFVDAQSGYLRSQQPQISWRNMEEQYYRLHQQCMYMQQQQQLRNEGLEASGNAATRLVNQNQRQSCFDTPPSRQHDQSNLWSNYVSARALNQSTSAFSSSDYNILNKMGKQSFPEKILTRSNGLNTLKAVNFGSVGGNKTQSHLSQNGKLLSNGHLCNRLSISSFDGWSLSPDLKSSKSPTQKYNSLDEVTGRIYLMAKDQHGCRFLQRKFSEGTCEDVDKIFIEIIDHIVELMTDPFGNYLVQKLLKVCREDQRIKILHAISRKPGDLVKISCDMHGTRAVQKVIETLKTPEQFSFVVSSLKPGILMLIKNMNGNHVAQRCLQYLMPEHNEFLFEAATNHCVELATDRHGCCVLQKCLVHFDGDQRRHIVCQITSNALILSQDPFGNYVVQYMFELQLPWAETDVLNQLEGNFGDLAMQKYSSNVVEKCLKCASEEWRASIIRELIAHLDQVMQDPYGNYVIQAALRQAKGSIHAALVEAIRPHVPVLRTSPYGKKVLSCNTLKNKYIWFYHSTGSYDQ